MSVCLPSKGILVGSDAELEWLLPWWWSNYSAHNDFAVTFADFGMTTQALNWCNGKGSILSLSKSLPIVTKEGVDATRRDLWEALYGEKVWEFRKSWFKKPLALAQFPYERTLWIDLDCQVIRNLTALFEEHAENDEIALCPEPAIAGAHQQLMLPGEIMYNSGVVLFSKNSFLIQHFAEMSLSKNHKHVGDQNLLSRLIFEEKWIVGQLSQFYNWRIYAAENNAQSIIDPRVAIIHWSCPWGKAHIKKYGGISEEFKAFLRALA